MEDESDLKQVEETEAAPILKIPELPKPYYQDDYVTLYHADCREILPLLEPVDLVLTDPPYGIGNFVQVTGNKRGKRVTWNEKGLEDNIFVLLINKSKHQIIWGSNYFNSFNGKGGAIVWVKNQPMPNFSKADIASCSFYKKVEIVTITWTNFVNTKKSKHPCERPVNLYEWCIDYAPSPQTMLDCFAGSGSSLIAARNKKIKAIGIEQSEEYCEMIVKRLWQEVLGL
jgi:DNA modification methylase